MTTITRRAARFAAALWFGVAATVASASPIVLDQWYTFGFDGTGGESLISGAGFSIGVLSVAAPDPSWDFVCAGPCVITVTDGFIPVDQFEFFDFGVFLGMTSVPSGDTGHTCSNDELVCLADPQMSHGAFIVGAGAHSLTGAHLAGIPGAAFFIVTAVPEPAPLLLLGAGLLLLVGLRRRP